MAEYQHRYLPKKGKYVNHETITELLAGTRKNFIIIKINKLSMNGYPVSDKKLHLS